MSRWLNIFYFKSFFFSNYYVAKSKKRVSDFVLCAIHIVTRLKIMGLYL